MRQLQFILSIMLLAVPCSAEVIYVKAGGTGSGTNWADAYGYLQEALDAAVSGDEIWVAEGTYYPTSDYGLGIGDRGKHFRMVNGVVIYGGFPDTGDPDMADRDPNQYETILSGDLLGNDNPATPAEDFPDDPCRTDNCYHVFYHPSVTKLNATAILDGFTITGGYAGVGTWPQYVGGGMYNYYSSPTLIQCTFSDNTATYYGGAMFNGFCNPIINNCIFINNSSGELGGGINNYKCDMIITDCTFTGNSADEWGGGIFNQDGNPKVENCIFSNNTSLNAGGGIYNWDGDPIVIHCNFISNSSLVGGGLYSEDGNLIVTNCTFSGNKALQGACMKIKDDGYPIVSNCTLSGNAGTYGSGIYNSCPNLIVSNCIIWGNNTPSRGSEIYNFRSNTPLISYCDIVGCGFSGAGWDNDLGTDGGGNIDDDPLFIDADGADNTPGTEDDNLRLLTGSPCIDAGDNSVVDANIPDLDGNTRIINDVVDMGAYEFLPAIEADVHIVPRIINRNNRLKRIIAIVRLPEGINKADVSDEPFVLSAEGFGDDGIEATWQRVIGRAGRVSVFAFFDKAELMDLVTGIGPVELTVTGKLKSGQYIYGSDTIRIVRPRRRRARLRRR
jgi:hypothetical protein